MECPVCYSAYNNENTQMDLPLCNHNICLNCLVETATKSNGTINCIVCHKEFTLDPPYTLESIDAQFQIIDNSPNIKFINKSIIIKP